MPNPFDNRKETGAASLFQETECPGFDALSAYQSGRLSGEDARRIEYHILDCELCAAVLEGLPHIEDKKGLKHQAVRINKRVDGLARASRPKPRPAPKRPGFTFKPAWGWGLATAVSAALLLLVLSNTLRPAYYELAVINTQERDMLRLVSDQSRGEEDERHAFSLGADLLLGAEIRHLGLFPAFDSERVKAARDYFQTAYEMTDEPFYQNKYAYFLGKASLMLEDAALAEKWFLTVSRGHSTAYQDAAARLLNSLSTTRPPE